MLRGQKLGEGTFGIVYAAVSPQSNRSYAVKRNLVELETDFLGAVREVDVLNLVRSHPNIVRLERVMFEQPFQDCLSPLHGEDRRTQRNDNIHFAFPKALFDLHRWIYGNAFTNFTLAKRYMVEILLAMEFLHTNGIVHRDLKPSNVLLFEDGAKICDFGLAKPYTYQGKQTPAVMTSWYRAPEVALGDPHYDYKIDVWSVGCIFFEIIAKRPFIPDVPDNDDQILSRILGTLPQQLSPAKFKELVRSNPWRRVRLSPIHSTKTRRSLLEQLNLDSGARTRFEKEAGSLSSFVDLLGSLLTFEAGDRCTVSEALDHSFFESFRNDIASMRRQHLQARVEPPLEIVQCMERGWMAMVAIEVFNAASRLIWYSDRVLFQAIDLFDRYLLAAQRNVPSNAVESKYRGRLHSQAEVEIRFWACLHLAVKYFTSVQTPVSFASMVPPVYRTAEAKLTAELFEGGLVKNCLGFQIYRPTIFEAADAFGDRLNFTDTRNLVMLAVLNTSWSGLTATELYQRYRTELRFDPDPVSAIQQFDAKVVRSPNSASTPIAALTPPVVAPVHESVAKST